MLDILSIFGEMLIKDVRDRSIREYDMIISGKMKDEDSQKIHEEIKAMGEKEYQLIDKIIPRIVDLTMHNMLRMIEENESLEMMVEKESIDEISDGLAGELYTEDGWIQRFSKQRYEQI